MIPVQAVPGESTISMRASEVPKVLIIRPIKMPKKPGDTSSARMDGISERVVLCMSRLLLWSFTTSLAKSRPSSCARALIAISASWIAEICSLVSLPDSMVF